MSTGELQDRTIAVADQRPLLRRILLAVDVILAAGSVGIVVNAIVQAPTGAQLARMDPEASWLPVFAAVVLIPLAILFAIAAIGQWRRYPWRWPVQWVAAVAGSILAALVVVSFLLP